jgi:hypothetical protein
MPPIAPITLPEPSNDLPIDEAFAAAIADHRESRAATVSPAVRDHLTHAAKRHGSEPAGTNEQWNAFSPHEDKPTRTMEIAGRIGEVIAAKVAAKEQKPVGYPEVTSPLRRGHSSNK